MKREKRNIMWNAIECALNTLMIIGFIWCIIVNCQEGDILGIVLNCALMIAFITNIVKNVKEIIQSKKDMKELAQATPVEPTPHKDVIFSWDYVGE